MAWIIGDGFDYYYTAADMGRGVWDVYTSGTVSTGGRFGGQPYRPGGGDGLTKTFPTNESTVFVVLAYYRPNPLTGTNAEAYFVLRDGATAQCTIVMQSNGSILLKSGIQTGTTLATYPAAFAQDVWAQFQIKVVIHPSAGSITVRKNGSPTDDFTATGLNTRVSANSYANSIIVGGTSSQVSVDDLLIYSGTAPAPNDWVGDIRAIQMPVVGDSSTAQYTVTPAALSQSAGGATQGAITLAANNISFHGPIPVTTRSGGVDRIRMTLGAGSPNPLTGHVKMAIYLNDGPNGPGTLVAVSQEVTNPPGGAGVTVDFTFSPPAPWSWRKTYYLATITDASWACASGYNAYGAAKFLAQPYASGFPSVVTTVTTVGTMQVGAVANITGHAIAVSDQVASVPDTDYVSGTVAGQAELYEMDDIVGNPLAIIGVVSKVMVKKSDAGTRTAQLVVRSAATEVLGVDTAISTTWGYLTRNDPVDPATGLAWTPGSFAGIKVGTRVTS